MAACRLVVIAAWTGWEFAARTVASLDLESRAEPCRCKALFNVNLAKIAGANDTDGGASMAHGKRSLERANCLVDGDLALLDW